MQQQKEYMTNNIIGIFEKVDFPELGITGITAKIDTGAYTGAIHCVEISEEVTDDGKVLKFVPLDSNHRVHTAARYRVLPVTSSNGQTEQRFAVHTTVVIRGVEYPIRITLAHRENMKYPVLIGRRFLRLNKLMVDAGAFRK